LTRFPRNRPRHPWPAMRNWAASPSCRLGGSVPAMAARRSVSKGAVAVRLAAPATPPASRWPVEGGVFGGGGGRRGQGGQGLGCRFITSICKHKAWQREHTMRWSWVCVFV
jgi:hypothetical protein